MTAARSKRVERLEDAALLNAAREAAVAYGLTAEETTDMLRDTRRALARWRAGMPIGLDWLLDEAEREYGLNEQERAELEASVRRTVAERAGAR